MTEDDARAWLTARFPDRLPVLEQFVEMLAAEAELQSLIARSTFAAIWSRHIVDSAQLVALAPETGVWLDIGSGGGLPGIVIAILRDAPVVLVEPRRMRGEFLSAAIGALNLRYASVRIAKVQAVALPATVISARAVAPIHDLFAWTRANVSRETRFLLPRGKTYADELAIAQHAWHGAFHVEQSLTDPESGIIVATDVRPR